MRVFVAGATGVIGRRLVPCLVGAGHTVAGMTRSSEKVEAVAAQDAIPILADVYDVATVQSEMLRFAPDLVMPADRLTR